MGYTTWFSGQFDLDKPLDDKTYELLRGLANTRRVMRAFRKEQGFGIDGEFYCEQEGIDGFIIDENEPPRTQPALWLQWVPTEDRLHLKWDGGEKFYEYTRWLLYIIVKILEPAGYNLSGTVEWQGESNDDVGMLEAVAGGVKMSHVKQPQPKLFGFEDLPYKTQCWRHARRSASPDPDCCFCTFQAGRAAEIDKYYEGQTEAVDWDKTQRESYIKYFQGFSTMFKS